MTNNNDHYYPMQKDERRRRARSRSDYSDRRRHPRYLSNFPVNIYVGDGENKQVYHAIAHDVSDGGLLLENIDIPATESRVHLEFKIPDGTMPENYLHGTFKLEADVRRRDNQNQQAVVIFKETLSQRLARSYWYYLRLASMFGLLLSVSLVLLIKYENYIYFWFDVRVFSYSLAVGFFLITRFLFSFFYRPPRPREDLPTVTVIIPALNEEKDIERTLVHAMEVAYPADKYQVITINDGSRDGTLAAMHRAQSRYPELVVVDFAEQRGKRAALASGARMATSELIVFADSDSFLQPSAIRNIVDSFADPEVAAVSGHCEVENQWVNLLTKMQSVRYYIGFRVMKAAESIFDSVTCLSGPLSAYRRDILLDLLDEWTNQTFMGKPATYGDDRSLTNSILKRHYKTLYDSRSRTTTMVPENYRQFYHQQIRWKRSWLRESIRASAFMWRKQPLMFLSFYLGIILPMLSPVIVLRSIIYVPLFYNVIPFSYLLGVLLMSTLMSTTYLLAKRSRLWVYGIHFCFFYMFVLVWQMPWAMLTFWKTHWGTRG